MSDNSENPASSSKTGGVAVRNSAAVTFVVVLVSLLFAAVAALLVGTLFRQVAPTQTVNATLTETDTWESRAIRFGEPRIYSGVLGVTEDGDDFRFRSETLFAELGGSGGALSVDASVDRVRVTGDIRAVTIDGVRRLEDGGSNVERIVFPLVLLAMATLALLRGRKMLGQLNWTLPKNARTTIGVLAPIVFLIVLLTAF